MRDAANRWVFPEQLADGLEPWGGVRAVWAAGSPRARTASTPPRRSTSASSRCEAHRAYIDGLGWENFDERELLEGFGRMTGTRMGVPFAAPFEVYSLTWGGTDEE